MNGRLSKAFIVALIIVISFAALTLGPVSAGGGIVAGPWRDINPTQYQSAGDTNVPGPNVPFNGIYVRTAGFGAVGAGAAWAVGGCGPTTTFAFPSGSGCAPTPPSGGTITYYDGFSWSIVSNPFSPAADHSFYTGVNLCTSPGSPSVGLCSPNGDGSDGWIVGGITTGPVALYVTGAASLTSDSASLPCGATTIGCDGTSDSGGYFTSVFETCHATNDPNGVGCPAGVPGDAYAVGTTGGGTPTPVVYEYSGGAPSGGGWTSMPITAAATPATVFNSVYMFIDPSGNLEGFAVGNEGVVARLSGGTWVENNVASLTTTFNGVAADSGNPIDAWAVGYDSSSAYGVIWHFASNSWTGPLSPSATLSGVSLESVFLVSGSEGWIVGQGSTILHGTGLPGSGFTAVSNNGNNILFSGTGAGVDLNSVSFQSSGAGWAVGTHGLILQTSDSSCGSIVPASSPSACWGGQTSIEQTTQLNAVYENSPSDAWAGGLWDTVNGFASLIHWDGYKWHRANIALTCSSCIGISKPDINGIYMVGSSEGYAVGGQLKSNGATCSATTYCPAAYTWNVIIPNWWQAVGVTQCANAAGCEMTSVYFATIGPEDGWAVGTNGGIWTYSKSSPTAGWGLAATNLGSSFASTLNSVFINNPGSSNNQAGWAVGNGGTVIYLSCSGGSCLWNSYSIPGLSSTVNLYGVYFANSNDGWIVGSQNTIITTTNGGGTWVVGSAANAANPSNTVWTSVHVDTFGTGSGNGDGWAVGYDTTTSPPNEVTAWFNGGGWTAINMPSAVSGGLGLYSVFTTSPSDGWAVGAQPSTGTNGLSAIFHLDPVVPPIVGQQVTTTSSSSVATITTPASVTSSTSFSASTIPVTTTSSLTTTVVSTSVSTMTVVSTPTTTSSSTTISVTTPMVLPAIPGFPWESIIAGIILGITALAIVRRRKK